ncbi:MAG: RdgB/HAM1 family non-canonical purine NTP pyrophosphatase [Lentisphaeria bacterium]|jgi:XTP/dITP diphosphohydrolase|nr:RdgB/HAM1 family non-canonical purine NTP pyrophosphatase [Lentisphaeria bacterium]MDY0177245.1 RdgB/HAM1 family non-canonical purine NTP pyrophosphatase [Lentisphaeria bacterium]
MSTYFLASRNLHKLAEMQAILRDSGVKLRSLAEVAELPEIDEDGDSFLANAVKKAVESARLSGRLVLADDSGLEVPALGGEPGVHSARYAGPNSSDSQNTEKLLRRMLGIQQRQARFVCVLALANPLGLIGTAEGEVRGRIALTPSGQGGFGYDPVFVPQGHKQSFAELSEDCKNQLSHRQQALQNALKTKLLK